jgi:hypothetical protein
MAMNLIRALLLIAGVLFAQSAAALSPQRVAKNSKITNHAAARCSAQMSHVSN